MQEWGLRPLAETIELLVSELVTNAVRACGSLTTVQQPTIRLWLISDCNSVIIHVWDGSAHMPARHDAGPDSECGRGLMLVECLSNEWGAYRKADGKVVWAMVSSQKQGPG
jgi:anti-sigma regulatory factor (Ser/Thr protein kinase)